MDRPIPIVPKNMDDYSVPAEWEPVLGSIVNAFSIGDYGLQGAHPSVRRPTPAQAENYREWITASEGLGSLMTPDGWLESGHVGWNGSHYEVVVDLWSQETGGTSDYILELEVYEQDDDYEFVIYSIYVP